MHTCLLWLMTSEHVTSTSFNYIKALCFNPMADSYFSIPAYVAIQFFVQAYLSYKV